MVTYIISILLAMGLGFMIGVYVMQGDSYTVDTSLKVDQTGDQVRKVTEAIKGKNKKPATGAVFKPVVPVDPEIAIQTKLLEDLV